MIDMPEILITPSDIVKSIELNKQRAELDFKVKFSVQNESLKSELKKIETQIAVIADKFIKGGLRVALPKENQLNNFNSELKKFKDSEILEALKLKQGKIYDLLLARGVIIKENFDNKHNVAKINILLSKFPVTIRTKLLEALREGKLSFDVSLDVDEKSMLLLAKLFNRLGVQVFVNGKLLSGPSGQPLDKNVTYTETSIILGNKCVWVAADIADNLIELNNKIRQISTKIQLRNAERQVKIFNENEEQEFVQLQSEYLSLLKNQDALLEDFYSEERELVFKFFTT